MEQSTPFLGNYTITHKLLGSEMKNKFVFHFPRSMLLIKQQRSLPRNRAKGTISSSGGAKKRRDEPWCFFVS
jgi:hypothetical protein